MTKEHEQRSLADAPDGQDEAEPSDPPAEEPEYEDVPFEQAVEDLEGIVRELESGDLALEDAMDRFETGLQLVKACRAKLSRAELRVEELQASGETTELE